MVMDSRRQTLHSINLILLFVFTLGCPAFSLAEGPFAGRFSDGRLAVDWTESGDSYTGTIALANQSFPSSAHADGANIAGTFVSGGNQFPFSATLQGDTLTLTTGGATYTLQRAAAAANPLGAGAHPAANSLAGYSVVTSTEAGRSMATRKVNVTSLPAALEAARVDLAHYFDGAPTIVRAYQDTQNQQSGGASFTATLRGQPVNGLISCRLEASGQAPAASIAVLYCNANASAADWSKLTATGSAATPSTAGATAGAAGTTPAIALHEYQFADGTGSIGLAEGWTTQATSCHGTFVITGPADQVITMQLNVTAVTPNSTAVRMNQQLNANARRLGGRTLPLGLYVAPFDTPVNVLQTLAPQMNGVSQQRSGVAFQLDHLKQIRENNPLLPRGKAAFVSYGISVTTNGQPEKHRTVLALIEVDPIANDSFIFGLSSAAAPDSTFKADLPVMLAIMNSLRENAAVFAQQTQQQITAMNQRFAAQQKANQEVQSAYDDYNKSIEHNELVNERSNANFDEIIRGYRTVEDTATGDKTSVDLGNVDQIVNTLNQSDPGRYKEIPLRDEEYPLPNGR
jgi:hypothetical protein